MACKTCDELQSNVSELLECLKAEKQQVAFEHERGDELQEACNAHKERADILQRMLGDERAKPSMEELLEMASAAAQIGYLSQKAFPGGSPITDEASSVASVALKQIRERLAEEADGDA